MICFLAMWNGDPQPAVINSGALSWCISQLFMQNSGLSLYQPLWIVIGRKYEPYGKHLSLSFEIFLMYKASACPKPQWRLFNFVNV